MTTDDSTTTNPTSPSESNPGLARPLGDDARVVQSADLFEGRRELFISHAGEIYRLRLTRKNRLILQK
jgi:hemin uptake protein HemP